eukprot:COSAG01_NODE_4677_length_4823_cov_6.381456_4_plen_32_part_00
MRVRHSRALDGPRRALSVRLHRVHVARAQVC